MTMTPPDPFGYGRIKLGADGRIRGASSSRRTARPSRPPRCWICNAGCYAFDGAQLAAHINEIGNDNAAVRVLPADMLEILKAMVRQSPSSTATTYRDGLGVNSRIQLAQLSPPSRATASTSTGWPGRHVHRSHAGLDRPRRRYRPRHRRVAADAP